MTPKAKAALVKLAQKSRAKAYRDIKHDRIRYDIGYAIGFAHGIEKALKAEKAR